MPGPLFVTLLSPAGELRYRQKIAGREILSDSPLVADARRLPVPAPAFEPPPIDGATEGSSATDYDGPAWTGERLERIVVRALGDRKGIDHEDGDRWEVDRSGHWIRRCPGGGGAGSAVARCFGAPLSLALEREGTYLLHAGALALDGRAIALVAPSGGGKSTLAAAARSSTGGLSFVADDMLPVCFASAPEALPRFPQLKIEGGASYSGFPERLALAAVVRIGHSPELGSIDWRELEPAEATIALVRATIGARLFDAAALSRHLERAAAAATRLRVAELRYPSGLGRLPEALEELVRRCR